MNCGLQSSGTKSFHFEFSEGKDFTADKSNSTHVATRCHCVHKESDFQKVIVSVKHLESGKILPLFYVFYDDGEHQIESVFKNILQTDITREGLQENVRQTKFSVTAEMKSLACEGLKGKTIFARLCKNAGGFENARSYSDFPNSTTQIYDIVRKEERRE